MREVFPMPALMLLMETEGPDVVLKKYFDSDLNVKADAPDGLKREVAAARSYEKACREKFEADGLL